MLTEEILNELEKEKLLYSYETGFGISKKEKYLEFFPKSIKKHILRRAYNLPKKRINHRMFKDILRLIAQKFSINFLIKHETGFSSIDSVHKIFRKERFNDSLIDRAIELAKERKEINELQDQKRNQEIESL